MTKYDFVHKLFEHCDINNVPVVLARPQLVENQGDIDILIEQKNTNLIASYIRQLKDIIIYVDYSRTDGRSIHFLYDKRTFKVDLISSCQIKGIEYAHVTEYLNRRVAESGLYFLDPIDQAFLLLMTHGIKHKGHIRPSYQDYIHSTYKMNKTSLSHSLMNHFNDNAALDLIEIIENTNFILLKRKSFIKSYLFNALSREPIRNTSNMIMYYLKCVLLSLSSKNMVLAFYGVDGAGKTTLIDNLLKQIDGSYPIIRHAHFMPSLPWKNEPDSKRTMPYPHAKAKRGGLMSAIKLTYCVGRYWLGIHWPRRLPALFVFDRYYDDMLVDPIRYRLSSSNKTIKLFRHLIPKADMSFYMDVAPETAFKRKPELPLIEIARQVQDYRTTIVQNRNYCLINAELPEKVAVQIAFTHFLNVLKSKETL